MKSYLFSIFIFTFLVFITSGSSDTQAQEMPISPDRPSFSPGTAIVGKGRLNAEFGYFHQFEKPGKLRASGTAPNLALRLGASNHFEIQLQWPGWNFSDAMDGSNDPESELQDINLGAKAGIFRGEKLNVSLIGLVSVPIDKSIDHSGIFNPTAGIIWDYSLTQNITAFGLFQGNTFKDGERIYQFQPAAGVSFSVAPKTGGYLEYFGNIPLEKNQNQHTVSAGLSHLLNSNLALDISGGIGLNDQSSNYIGAGMSVRF